LRRLMLDGISLAAWRRTTSNYQQLPDAVPLEVDDDRDPRAGAAVKRLNVDGHDAAAMPWSAQ
jgi:hypothetical protein